MGTRDERDMERSLRDEIARVACGAADFALAVVTPYIPPDRGFHHGAHRLTGLVATPVPTRSCSTLCGDDPAIRSFSPCPTAAGALYCGSAWLIVCFSA